VNQRPETANPIGFAVLVLEGDLRRRAQGGTMRAQMTQRERRSRPAVLQVALAIAGVLLLAAAYVAAMHATVDVSKVDNVRDADRRDTVYLGIHLVGLVLAAIIGFALGKWLSGLGLAFGMLFVVLVGLSMVGVQLSSFELACHGRNDIVRHWTC
jgi:hypothetical protein